MWGADQTNKQGFWGGDREGGGGDKDYRNLPYQSKDVDLREKVPPGRHPDCSSWRQDVRSDELGHTKGSLLGRPPGTQGGANTVPSKDSLAKSTPPAANSKQQQQNQQDIVNMMKGDWPDSLKRYVERCFCKCVTDLDKDQVEIVLKGKLTAAAKTGSLWSHNWDNELVPNVHSDSMIASIRNKFPTRGDGAIGDMSSSSPSDQRDFDGCGRGGFDTRGRGGFDRGRGRFDGARGGFEGKRAGTTLLQEWLLCCWRCRRPSCSGSGLRASEGELQ
ncbi:hypothetical protein FHG87_002749 [Trinorchestia longiramus]|nr:hypothetical protein FHG87_002749 [Trinorchestia longiramus]